MKFLKNIRAWQRSFFRKRRFNMLNATDNSEEWHMHLSPASIFAAFVSFALLLFILILTLDNLSICNVQFADIVT